MRSRKTISLNKHVHAAMADACAAIDQPVAATIERLFEAMSDEELQALCERTKQEMIDAKAKVHDTGKEKYRVIAMAVSRPIPDRLRRCRVNMTRIRIARGLRILSERN